MFSCGLHGYSTDSPEEWDKHCAELEHEFDLHIECATGCGEKLHIKPNQKLSPSANRIPSGYLCPDCKNKVQDVPEIKEAGEVS